MAKLRWMDVSAYGAQIKIIPNNPLRGIPLTVLEVTDTELFSKRFYEGFNFSQDKNEAGREHFQEQLRDLGFDDQAIVAYDANNKKICRYFSVKSEFSLNDLRRVFPGLGAESQVEVNSERIIYNVNAEEYAAEWKAFIQSHLSNDAINVFTPKFSRFDKHFNEARPLRTATPEVAGTFDQEAANKGLNGFGMSGNYPLIKSNTVIRNGNFMYALEKADYRENALIDYFADLESAKRCGYLESDLDLVDMPFVLPLWVDQGGRITGIKDIRYVPELFSYPPRSLTRSLGTDDSQAEYKNIQIVSLIRDANEIKPAVIAIVERWKAFADAPEGQAKADEPQKALIELEGLYSGLQKKYSRLPDTGIHESINGESVVRDISTMDLKTLSRVAHLAHQLASEINYAALFDQLNTVSEKTAYLRKKEALDAAAHAQQSLMGSIKDRGDEKVIHVDAGEKIGGARKDFGRYAIRLEELAEMNELELKTYVIKSSVWPPLNYAALREQGVTPEAALALKVFKDSINPKPDFRYEDTRGDYSSYIVAVEKARDLMSGVKTLDEFIKQAAAVYEFARQYDPKDETQKASKSALFGHTSTQIMLGKDICDLIYSAAHYESVGSSVSNALRKHVRCYENEEDKWKYLIKPSKKKTDAELENEKKGRDRNRELHCPHLDHVVRDGTDWRQGKDVVADDILTHFGFRAVEFGNWLANDERQIVLNYAYDSFCDLAYALDLPPKAIGFDGELAIAFGSRGHGGAMAALAHFEPTKFAINLTRMKGAGTLAHEWIHSFDWYLGGRSEFQSHLKQQLPMRNLVNDMMRKTFTADEIEKNSNDTGDTLLNWAASWVSALRNEREIIEKMLLEQKPVILARLCDEANKSLLRYAREGDSLPETIQFPGVIGIDVRSEIAEYLEKHLHSDNVKKPGSRELKNAKNCVLHAVNYFSAAATVGVSKALKLKLPKRFLFGKDEVGQDTDFLQNAKKLDQTRTESYWATPHEMLARAGAAFVQDQLLTKGVRNDYLVHGASAEQYAASEWGNPNPTGDDRQVANENFKALVDAYRLEFVNRHKPPVLARAEMQSTVDDGYEP